MAHVTCIAAARHSLLAEVGWDVERNGLVGATRVRFVTNDQRHGSIERALRLLGLGTSCIVDIPTDAQGRIEQNLLEEVLADDVYIPTIVLLQAGDFLRSWRAMGREAQAHAQAKVNIDAWSAEMDGEGLDAIVHLVQTSAKEWAWATRMASWAR
jgi:hypothetical protein